jgi:hypothetical protein
VEYHLEKDLNKILDQEDLLDFKAKCMLAQQEINLSSRKFVKVVQLTRKYWYAAASVLLIAMITGGLFLLNPGGYSAEKLFKMYYKSGETIGVSRSGNANMVEACIPNAVPGGITRDKRDLEERILEGDEYREEKRRKRER